MTHCYTRLRFTLREPEKADRGRIERVEGVIAVVESSGQLQVAVGTEVGPVYDMMKKMDGTERKTGKEGEPVYHKDRKGRWTHTGSYDAVQKQGPKGGGGISISFFGAAIMTFLL